MRTVYRYTVPVDDDWHPVATTGHAFMVGARETTTVEFWAMVGLWDQPVTVEYRVFGTGHPIPDGSYHVGSAVTPDGQFVWHLFYRYIKAREETAHGEISSAAHPA